MLFTQNLALSKELTLDCMCVIEHTNTYIQLEPMTFDDKGKIKIKNKSVGKYTPAPDNNAIFGILEKSSFSYDFERGLFIQSYDIDGKTINCYGSCK